MAERSLPPSCSWRRQDDQQRHKPHEREDDERQRIFECTIFAANRATTGLNRKFAFEIVEENKKVRDQATHRAGSKPPSGTIDMPKADGNQGEPDDKRNQRDARQPVSTFDIRFSHGPIIERAANQSSYLPAAPTLADSIDG